MKKFFTVMGAIFAVAMAVLIGTRISADALAVIIGIICGVLASIPTSAILVWVLRQRDRQYEMQAYQTRYGGSNYPPVVVVNGQGTNGYNTPSLPPALTGGMPGPMPRDFKVIGQENTESSGDILTPFWDQV